jgi:hypothetical protein
MIQIAVYEAENCGKTFTTNITETKFEKNLANWKTPSDPIGYINIDDSDIPTKLDTCARYMLALEKANKMTIKRENIFFKL